MANKKNDLNLGYLGQDNQMRIVKALMEDKHFFVEVESVMDQNSFTEPKLREIVGIMKDFFKTNGYPINYKELELKLRDKAHTDLDIEEGLGFIEALKKDDYLIGMETAKQMASKFFKQQETIKVCQKELESLGKDGFNEEKVTEMISSLQNMLNKATNINSINLIDIFDRVMERTEEDKVPTGVFELDEAMKGGLSKGMLGLLIAGTGAGKSTLASIFCGEAAMRNYKVVQIFFEEKTEEIAAKHYAHFSGNYTNQMNNKTDKLTVWNKIKELYPNADNAFRNNIRLIRMENGSTQVEDIRNKLNKLMSAEGFKPDMVFIDYFSCLQKSSNKMVEYDNECKAGEKAMKKLEQLASDMNIAIWVAEQTNRNGVKMNTANDRIANIQGSFRVTQPASFILYLDRVGAGGDFNRANLYMDKCRGCEPKSWEGIYLNNGNLDIDLSHIIRVEDPEFFMDEKDIYKGYGTEF